MPPPTMTIFALVMTSPWGTLLGLSGQSTLLCRAFSAPFVFDQMHRFHAKPQPLKKHGRVIIRHVLIEISVQAGAFRTLFLPIRVLAVQKPAEFLLCLAHDFRTRRVGVRKL